MGRNQKLFHSPSSGRACNDGTGREIAGRAERAGSNRKTSLTHQIRPEPSPFLLLPTIPPPMGEKIARAVWPQAHCVPSSSAKCSREKKTELEL